MRFATALRVPALLLLPFAMAMMSTACRTAEGPEPMVANSSTPVALAHASQPEWVLNPSGPNGELGGVGHARVHVRGVSYQRQLAIARGMEEIARQKGVKVDSVLESLQVDSGVGRGTSSSTLFSIQTTTGETIRARLEALWVVHNTGELYAWLLATD